jgi:hypothetical protein
VVVVLDVDDEGRPAEPADLHHDEPQEAAAEDDDGFPQPEATTVDRVDSAGGRLERDGGPPGDLGREMVHDGAGREDHVVGPAAVDVEAEERLSVAEVVPAAPAVPAAATRDDLLRDDPVAERDPMLLGGSLAHGGDRAGELVPRDAGSASPHGPVATPHHRVVDPHADPGYLDQELAGPGRWDLHLLVAKVAGAVRQDGVHHLRDHTPSIRRLAA